MTSQGRVAAGHGSTDLAHQRDHLPETVSRTLSSGRFSYYVHSQQDLTSVLPPDAETSRSKRKRTSPADHAFLEAEYQRDPKPDKAARTSIVQRVALNDKEVQIWFQNRRQVTRRKSRPLLPQELYSSFLSSQESGNDLSGSSFTSSREAEPSSDSNKMPVPNLFVVTRSQREDQVLCASESGSRCSTSPMALGYNQGRHDPEPDENGSAIDRNGRATSTIKHATSDGADCRYQASSSVSPLTCATMNAIGETNSVYSVDPCVGGHIAPGVASAITPNSPFLRTLTRTASFARLSTSLDGTAHVIMGTGNTPSPPGKLSRSGVPTQRPALLQHCNSATEMSTQYSSCNSNSSSLWPRRSVPGRSRDPRAWEFYCDSDARNELNLRAEQEGKGSAVGLLGLIRSGSASSSGPQSYLRRQSSQPSRAPLKRKGTSVMSNLRPKFARKTSSVARLQTVDGNARVNARTDQRSKGKLQQDYSLDPSGESDKENWEPGTQTRKNNRQKQVFERRRTVLKERHSMSMESLLNRENLPPRRGVRKEADAEPDKENIGADAEVSRFMGETNHPRHEDDLDCVQHLLSLSQGAWQ